MKARTVMIHQQVNRRHAVHLHQTAKPEKETEREWNEMVNVFEECTNDEFKERNSREKNRLEARINWFQEQRKRTIIIEPWQIKISNDKIWTNV